MTYSSGLIPPPEEMSTLAVFYDKVWLPYTGKLNLDGTVDFMAEDSGLQETVRFPQEQYEEVEQARSQWESLFRQDILQILPAPCDDLATSLIVQGVTIETGSLEARNEFAINALSSHLARSHKLYPEIFVSDPSDTRTSRLAGFLVRSLFDYKVPQLQALNAEQILEVRDYLKDTKEGFAYYINEMTDDVEKRIQEHNLSDIEAAQKTFERKILPQYAEFQRKLAAKKWGLWSKVAAVGGTFLLVSTAEWSLPFLGAIAQMCGFSLSEFAKSEQENFLTNKSQAFHYLAKLESKVSK